jgi:hypothetical protein
MNKYPYCTDVILYFLGEGQCLPHQPRNPFPQRVVQSLDELVKPLFLSTAT